MSETSGGTADVAERSLIALPKVHVHVHLDGSYPLAAVRELAVRRGVGFETPAGFSGVWDFFRAYGTVPQLVETHEDLAILCRALVAQEAAQGVLYLEPAIEPQLYAPRLGSLVEVTRTMLAAFAESSDDYGIEVGANLTINTDEDAELSEVRARIAASFAGAGVTAFGTACFNERTDLGAFVPATRIALAAGLPVVSHAGQTGGPECIVAALDQLGATRISHGIRSVESAELLARLADESIVCDICPASNVGLGVVASLAEHPAPALVAAGVPVTLNADDQLWFGASVTDQFETARAVWGLDDAAIASIAAGGLLIAGMSTGTRSRYALALKEWSAPAEQNEGTA